MYYGLHNVILYIKADCYLCVPVQAAFGPHRFKKSYPYGWKYFNN